MSYRRGEQLLSINGVKLARAEDGV